MKKCLGVFTGLMLASAPVYAEQTDSSLFLTPSIGYALLSQASKSTGYELDGQIMHLGVDIEIIGDSFAYHRLTLGHSLADDSTQTHNAAEQDAEVSYSHYAYRVGGMNLSSFAGDLAVWTGLGWQGYKVQDKAEDESHMRFIYLPFGADLGLHHAGNTFFVVGGEYRLLVRGSEKYRGSSIYNPTQNNGGGYSVWLGMDYLTSNRRVLMTRLTYDQWKTSASADDEVPGSKLTMLGLNLGVRF